MATGRHLGNLSWKLSKLELWMIPLFWLIWPRWFWFWDYLHNLTSFDLIIQDGRPLPSPKLNFWTVHATLISWSTFLINLTMEIHIMRLLWSYNLILPQKSKMSDFCHLEHWRLALHTAIGTPNQRWIRSWMLFFSFCFNILIATLAMSWLVAFIKMVWQALYWCWWWWCVCVCTVGEDGRWGMGGVCWWGKGRRLFWSCNFILTYNSKIIDFCHLEYWSLRVHTALEAIIMKPAIACPTWHQYYSPLNEIISLGIKNQTMASRRQGRGGVGL